MPSERRAIKKGIDVDDCRKGRAAAKIELRKAKKEEGIQKRRASTRAEEATEEVTAVEAALPTDFDALAAVALGFVASNGAPEQFDNALAAVKSLRKKLSLTKGPPIDECIAAGLVPAFVTMLQHPDTKMQFESAWCLTNIASGTSAQCDVVVTHNGVPGLAALLRSPDIEVCEQAVWAVGNIAGDCPRLRDIVLASGAADSVINMIESTAQLGQIGPLRNAVWALSNMVRGKPQPSATHVAKFVPVLARLLLVPDEEVHVDTCWALSYATDGGDDRIDMVVGANTVGSLMSIVRGTEAKARTPALRTLCNILTGSTEATQAVIDAGVLDVLPNSLKSPKMQVRKEACWALSNITAGSAAQVELVLGSSCLLAVVIEKLGTDEYEVKKEAAWVLANVLNGFKTDPSERTAARATALVQLGCLRPMCDMLEVNDAAMQKLMLEAVTHLLSAGEFIGRSKGSNFTNPFIVPFDEAEGIDQLEKLQEHTNQEIYDLAVETLDTYFQQDDEDDENLLPNTAADGGFSFGVQPATAEGAAPGFAFASPQPAFAF